MTDMTCPVCQHTNHQTFWYWEKEDQLIREWAMDTRVHFSICRDCGLIFQNPPVVRSEMEEFGFGDWGTEKDTAYSEEPLVWLKQFTPNGEKKGRVLEVYTQEQRFTNRLREQGWAHVKAITANQLLQAPAEPGAPESLQPGEQFDVVICFDALGQTQKPLDLLMRIHPLVADGGGLFAEVENPLVQPRLKKLCLTSNEMCVFPFHTLVFTMHKAGFLNAAAEMWNRIRFYGNKIDPSPDIDPIQSIPTKVWEHALYRFQRNYVWAWACRYLEDYLQKRQVATDALDQTRAALHQDPYHLANLRDVCGACLLFAQEVTTLRETLAEDWAQTMHRLFEVFKHDFALYEMFQLGSVPKLGVFPGIDRYHFNEKLIYMTNRDYFEKYFSEEEARRLCDGLVQAGHVVCGHLSSFL